MRIATVLHDVSVISTSPAPRRVRTPGWLDLRLVAGVALVLVSLLIVGVAIWIALTMAVLDGAIPGLCRGCDRQFTARNHRVSSHGGPVRLGRAALDDRVRSAGLTRAA